MAPMARRFLFACSLSALFCASALAQQPDPAAGGDGAAPPAPAAKTVVVTPPPADGQDAPPGGAQVVLTPEAQQDAVDAAKAKAKALIAEARKAYSTGLYERAIAKFREAFDLTNDVELLYNIAITHQALRDWENCVAVMNDYLAKSPAGPSPKRDRAANAKDNCEARIERDQKLSITTTPPGANVWVDNKNAGVKGQTPFEVPLRPGKHRIWIELDGYEPVMQDIEVQKSEPFRLNLALAQRVDRGFLFIDASIKNANVFIDGRSVGLTPFSAPQQIAAGAHQVVVERDGYTRISQQATIERGQMTTIDAYMVRTETDAGWRTNVGITSIVLGALAMGGGFTAMYFANQEYNDTDEFDTLAGYERLGYGVGGGLLAIGTSLIIWDLSRDVIDGGDRNPAYGRPAPPPQAPVPTTPAAPAAPSARLQVGPGMIGVGGTF